jgi:hypothetical protein
MESGAPDDSEAGVGGGVGSGVGADATVPGGGEAGSGVVTGFGVASDVGVCSGVGVGDGDSVIAGTGVAVGVASPEEQPVNNVRIRRTMDNTVKMRLYIIYIFLTFILSVKGAGWQTRHYVHSLTSLS